MGEPDERTPLRRASSQRAGGDHANLKTELVLLLSLSWPLMFTYAFEYVPEIISVLFVGWLGQKEYLDAAAMATMVRV